MFSDTEAGLLSLWTYHSAEVNVLVKTIELKYLTNTSIQRGQLSYIIIGRVEWAQGQTSLPRVGGYIGRQTGVKY